jgi:hypothetical protein
MTEGQADTLQEAFDELLRLIVKPQVPSAVWRGEVFVGEKEIDWYTRTVSAEVFKGWVASVKLFEELLAARRSWIKLSALGMWNGMLVIEMSWADHCNPIARSDLLYAGFMKIVADDPTLSLTAVLTVEGTVP